MIDTLAEKGLLTTGWLNKEFTRFERKIRRFMIDGINMADSQILLDPCIRK